MKWLGGLPAYQAGLIALAGLIAACAAPVANAIREVRKARRAMLSVPPTAPSQQEEGSGSAALAPAARITELESRLRDTEWQRDELERVLGDARREIAQLRSSLTRARLAREKTLEELDHTAHAIELDRIQQRLVDSGLTPVDEPPPLPTRVARRPRRPT